MKMPGYDTHGAKYPEEWDKEEEKEKLLHWEVEDGVRCNGDVIEYYEVHGIKMKTFFYCEECGEELTSAVIGTKTY